MLVKKIYVPCSQIKQNHSQTYLFERNKILGKINLRVLFNKIHTKTNLKFITMIYVFFYIPPSPFDSNKVYPSHFHREEGIRSIP